MKRLKDSIKNIATQNEVGTWQLRVNILEDVLLQLNASNEKLRKRIIALEKRK